MSCIMICHVHWRTHRVGQVGRGPGGPWPTPNFKKLFLTPRYFRSMPGNDQGKRVRRESQSRTHARATYRRCTPAGLPSAVPAGRRPNPPSSLPRVQIRLRPGLSCEIRHRPASFSGLPPRLPPPPPAAPAWSWARGLPASSRLPALSPSPLGCLSELWFSPISWWFMIEDLA
jgi:hypothetical protein